MHRRTAPAISLKFIATTALTWLTFAWFIFYSGAIIVGGFLRHIMGGDAVLYAAAARAWLTGGNPWLTTIEWAPGTTNTFAAPPPSLLAFAPFAFLPDPVVATFWVAADVVAIVLVVRKLGRPWLWCLFPPAIDATVVGSPDPVMLAVLLLAPGHLRGLAPVVKVYGAIPLLAERHWRAAAIAAAILLITVPILPWATFFASSSTISRTFELIGADLSAWSIPVLLVLAVAALVVLGAKSAGWLAVPVLWPYASLHYATIALPALPLGIAILYSLPVPGASAIGVIALAIVKLSDRAGPRRRSDTSAGSAAAIAEA